MWFEYRKPGESPHRGGRSSCFCTPTQTGGLVIANRQAGRTHKQARIRENGSTRREDMASYGAGTKADMEDIQAGGHWAGCTCTTERTKNLVRHIGRQDMQVGRTNRQAVHTGSQDTRVGRTHTRSTHTGSKDTRQAGHTASRTHGKQDTQQEGI